jgi:hypothetical protein
MDDTTKSDLHNSLGNLGLNDDDDDNMLDFLNKSDSGVGNVKKERRGTRNGRTKAPTSSGDTKEKRARSTSRDKSTTSSKSATSDSSSPRKGSRPTKSKSTSDARPRSSSRDKSGASTSRVRSTSRDKSKSATSSVGRKGVRPKSSSNELTVEDIPLKVLEKLAILSDPDVPLKERVQLEVDMMKDPYEKKVMVDFRQKFDRKKFLEHKAEYEQNIQEKIHADILTEAEKEKEFKRVLAEKRQKEVEEEIAKAEREAQMLKDARTHAAKSIAEGMEQVRKDAEKTVQVASVNRLKKQKEQEALEREIEQFRRTEGKYMHEAQRALKEAMITQKYIDRDDD